MNVRPLVIEISRLVRPTDAPPLFAALRRVIAPERAPAPALVLESIEASGSTITLGLRDLRPGEGLPAVAARSFVPLLGDDEGEVLGTLRRAQAAEGRLVLKRPLP